MNHRAGADSDQRHLSGAERDEPPADTGGSATRKHKPTTGRQHAPMNTTDAAVAVALNQDRERQALERAAAYKAQAQAEFERSDPDDLAGDIRVEVYRHLTACADLFERYADDCRERWVSALAPGDDFTPRGLATCEHKCCPPAVCEFVGDCEHHVGGAA